MRLETVENKILTKAETRLLPLLAAGKNSIEIAALRYRSVCTVRRQIESARNKMGANNVAHLVAMAFSQGILRALVLVLAVVMSCGSLDRGFRVRTASARSSVSRCCRQYG